MANNLQPWAAYRALMLGSLVGLDNFTGVRPVGVGETWRWMMEKFVLVVTGAEEKEACRKEHLCSEGFPGHRAKIYHNLVLQGKLWYEVWWITERDKGGLLQPEETCPQTHLTFLDILQSNHPKSLTPSVHSIEDYGGKPPEMVPVDNIDVKVDKVARQLSGSAGQGG